MSIRFETLAEGTVVQSPVVDSSSVVTAGSRCAVARDGSLVCVYSSQSKLGINDFVPMITRSDENVRKWSPPRMIWPELAGRYSVFCNLSRDQAGVMYLFGSRTVID